MNKYHLIGPVEDGEPGIIFSGSQHIVNNMMKALASQEVFSISAKDGFEVEAIANYKHLRMEFHQ